MTRFRSLRLAAFAATLLFGSMSLRAQTHTNSLGTIMWPANPPVGIGTETSGGAKHALQIHYASGVAGTKPAELWLSDGSSTTSTIFGTLALLPDSTGFPFASYSDLAHMSDLVLHENMGLQGNGNLILTNFNAGLGAIRMATTPDPTTLPLPGPFVPPADSDIERMTILANGNIGIDLPPDSSTMLGKPMDQLQIGGGIVPEPGYAAPIPGLTMYGGNRFEGMLKPPPDTGSFGWDYRYLSFNHYQDHYTRAGARFAPLGASGIYFSDLDTLGMVQLQAVPWWTGDSLSDWSGGTTLNITGDGGLSLWCDQRRFGGIQYHHLLDVLLPGQTPWPVTRNTNGLTIFHTPMLITSDSTSTPSLNFQNLTNSHRTWATARRGI